MAQNSGRGDDSLLRPLFRTLRAQDITVSVSAAEIDGDGFAKPKKDVDQLRDTVKDIQKHLRSRLRLR